MQEFRKSKAVERGSGNHPFLVSWLPYKICLLSAPRSSATSAVKFCQPGSRVVSADIVQRLEREKYWFFRRFCFNKSASVFLRMFCLSLS